MENILNNKKIGLAVLILLIILSLFTLAKLVNEVKGSKYVGRGNQPANTIIVNGTGEATAVADIATLNINISKDAKTSGDAQNALNDSVAKVITYLKDQKIDDKDIKSEFGGITPKYSYSNTVCITYPCPQNSPTITGYTASQSISVKVRAVDNANQIRTGIANLGITDITGPTFTIDNEDAIKDQARADAIKNAKDKAKVLADELGVKLGKVVSFSENTGGPIYGAGVMKYDMAATREATPAPELPKGENKVTSNVSITYEIR